MMAKIGWNPNLHSEGKRHCWKKKMKEKKLLFLGEEKEKKNKGEKEDGLMIWAFRRNKILGLFQIKVFF